MYYKFNETTLQFEKTSIVVNRNRIIGGLLFSFIVLPILLSLSTNKEAPITEKLSVEEKMIIVKDHNKFSEVMLIIMIGKKVYWIMLYITQHICTN